MDSQRSTGASPLKQAQYLSNLHAQLREQATPRAMAGLAVLAAILAIWGLGTLSASVSSLRSEVDELERQRRLELSLLNDQGWLSQAGDVQAQLTQTQETFWVGATDGIIAAQLQGAVEAAARNAGLSRVRVNVTGAPEPLGDDAILFEISVSARDADGQFLAFFQELSRTDNLVVITRFDWQRRNGSLDIRLSAPARRLAPEVAS